MWRTDSGCLEARPMTMIERPTNLEGALRVPAAWLSEHAPEQLVCECPEACLLDHDN
jgi:hypothetical protein